MPGDRRRGQQDHARPGAAGEEAAGLGGGGADRAPPPGHDGDGRGDGERDAQQDQDPARRGPGQDARPGGDEHGSGAEQHDLPGEPLQHDGPDPAPDIARTPAVTQRASDIAQHPGREHRVEQRGAVVGAGGRGQGQRQTQRPGDEAPPPGAGDGGEQSDPEREDEASRTDEPQPGDEHPGADVGHERQEDPGGGEQAQPRPQA
ncbi:hypothetical protein FB470_004969 [Amycolatopsis thermophila]|uniref:Uncharacterized protein n=1 Tax=Amycolatopsis thermophila TaxID=206084 RepID=A0ABU0F078_9PSEU|nr:hypothetical protein [Amycolatopsis thermophila]